MDWQDYEEVTARIYEALGRASGVKILCYGHQCRLNGRSGAAHQIDVLTSHSDGVHTYRTCIECKYWNEKVDKAVIAKQALVVEDTATDKGVVVSKSGFTEGAKLVAREKRIGLVELRRPLDSDWDGYIKAIDIRIHLCYPSFSNFEFIVPKTDEYVDSMPFGGRVLHSNIRFHTPDGESESLLDLTNRVARFEKGWETGEERPFVVPFEKETTFSVEGHDTRTMVNEVRFTATMHVLSEDVHVNAEHHVEFLMKEIFEGRRFVVAPDGTIKEIGTTQ